MGRLVRRLLAPKSTQRTMNGKMLHFHAAFIVLSLAAAGNTFGAPTFSKDIAPIFFQKCTACHHPNDIAPMSLLTYRDARPWAKAIKSAVVATRMPPWYADPRFGTFENKPALSAGEIARI